jgi:hypothetical protein
MRLAIVVLLVGWVTVASADDGKALKPYAGHLVLAHDPPPTVFAELPAFLKTAFDPSDHYEFMKWEVDFVGVLAKPADKVTLVVLDGKTALVSIELAAAKSVVIGHFTPTKAAGFVVGKPYAMTLVSGKTTLAKAELLLRD